MRRLLRLPGGGGPLCVSRRGRVSPARQVPHGGVPALRGRDHAGQGRQLQSRWNPRFIALLLSLYALLLLLDTACLPNLRTIFFMLAVSLDFFDDIYIPSYSLQVSW